MREMKDSGIEWIGEIPADWEITKLKYVTNVFLKGYGITKEDIVVDGDVPCVRYGEIYTKYNHSFSECFTRTNLNKVSSPKYFSYGDILFCCTGELVEEIGKSIVYLGNEKCLAGGDILVAQHSQEPSFMGYALDSFYAQEQKSYGKAKLKVVHISSSDIANLYIVLPSLPEQRKIAAYLDKKCGSIDSLTKTISEQIETLEQYKRSVITKAVTKGLDPDAEMKDSGVEWIGKIPKDWDVIRIKYLADTNIENSFVDGDWIESPFIQDYGIRYLTSGNIGDGNYKEQGDGYISKETFDILNCKFAYPGDLVFSRLNAPYGRSCILPNTFSQYVLAVDNVILRPVNEVTKQYICYVTQCIGYQGSVNEKASGTTMRRISRLNLGKIKILFPPISEQHKIVSYLDKKCNSIDNLIQTKQDQLSALDEYKKSLIYEYVTGKKEVPINYE